MEGRQAPTSNLFLFTGLAPTVAAVGCDAQEEVGGHRGNGDHEAHKCDEEVIIQGQSQVTGLEALLSEGEERGTLNFRGAPALSQLRICNTECGNGEGPGRKRVECIVLHTSQENLRFLFLIEFLLCVKNFTYLLYSLQQPLNQVFLYQFLWPWRSLLREFSNLPLRSSSHC